MRKLKRMKKRGFTLIELIVVMAVLGILVTIGAPRLMGFTQDAQLTAMQADVGIIETAIARYQATNADALPNTVSEEDPTIYVALESDGESTPTYFFDFNDDDNVDEGEAVSDDILQTVVGEGEDYTALVGNLYIVNEVLVDEYIRSLSNELTDYFMTDQGEVFSTDIYTNSSDVDFTGLVEVVPAE